MLRRVGFAQHVPDQLQPPIIQVPNSGVARTDTIIQPNGSSPQRVAPSTPSPFPGNTLEDVINPYFDLDAATNSEDLLAFEYPPAAHPNSAESIIANPVDDLPILPAGTQSPDNPDVHQHTCPATGCGKSYRHRRSLVRHQQEKHTTHAPRYECLYPGCSRVGNNAFLRSERLVRHQRDLCH